MHCPRLVVIIILFVILCSPGMIEGKTKRETYQDKLTKLKPDDIKGHYRLGTWCLRNKLSREAQTHFERVLEMDPAHKHASKKLIQAKRLKLTQLVQKKSEQQISA